MKENENFIKFSEDIAGNKKTVLFVGAGVNYSKHNPMTCIPGAHGSID